MKKLVAIALAATFVGTFALAAFADGAFTVQKAAIKIDGKVDDWAKIPTMHIEGDKWAKDAKAVDNNSFDWATAYDGGDTFYLYINAVTPVVSFWQDLGSVWNQTGAEVFFGGAQLGMGIDPDGVPGFGFKDGGKDIKVWTTPKGWAMEASYSFKTLNDNYSDLTGATFAPGTSFQFSVGVDITDTDGGTRTGQLYYPETWVWGQVDTFATATLAK